MSTQLIHSGGLMQTLDLSQVVYLDFDGESTAYNGEILTVDNVEVQNSNLTQERIQQITTALNEQFASQNVLFVSEKSELSTSLTTQPSTSARPPALSRAALPRACRNGGFR